METDGVGVSVAAIGLDMSCAESQSSDRLQGSRLNSSYNPYSGHLMQLESQLSRSRRTQVELEDELRWHSEAHPQNWHTELASLDVQAQVLAAKLSAAAVEKNALCAQIAVTRQSASLGLDPRYWFSAERKRKKAALRKLESMQKEIVALDYRLSAQCAEVQKQSEAAKAALDRYGAINRAELAARCAAETAACELLAIEISDLRPLSDRVDSELRPVLHEIAKSECRKLQLTKELDDAKLIEKELSAATLMPMPMVCPCA